MATVDSFFEDDTDTPERDPDALTELIRRRRAQMIMHSYLYYRMDSPIISDDQWQAWANELAALQSENPDLCKMNFHDKYFVDWTGDTGIHLPADGNVRAKAEGLLANCQKAGILDSSGLVIPKN